MLSSSLHENVRRLELLAPIYYGLQEGAFLKRCGESKVSVTHNQNGHNHDNRTNFDKIDPNFPLTDPERGATLHFVYFSRLCNTLRHEYLLIDYTFFISKLSYTFSTHIIAHSSLRRTPDELPSPLVKLNLFAVSAFTCLEVLRLRLQKTERKLALQWLPSE